MGTSDATRRIGYPIAAFALILADQIAKTIAVDRGAYVLNTGISFGFLRGTNAIMIVVASVALVLFIYLLAFRDKEFHSDLGLLFLIAGTAGNLIDRITIGAVVDFIRVPFSFPTFNFSDAYLTIGILIIIYATLKADRSVVARAVPEKPQRRTASSPANRSSMSAPSKATKTKSGSKKNGRSKRTTRKRS